MCCSKAVLENMTPALPKVAAARSNTLMWHARRGGLPACLYSMQFGDNQGGGKDNTINWQCRTPLSGPC